MNFFSRFIGVGRLIRPLPVKGLRMADQHQAAVHEIGGLDTALDESLFPEQIDEPKPLTLGLYASDVFHDFLLFIS